MSLEFKQAILPSGSINPTRWREFPTPRRECDGYTIAMYEYDSTKGSNGEWVDPYYVVYHNSMNITHPAINHPNLEDAINAARAHQRGERHG